MKNNKIEKYLFLGFPQSGKTTYFSIMANRLQQLANRTKNLTFSFLPTEIRETDDAGETTTRQEDITQDFIEDRIQELERGEWVKKTQYEDRCYSFLLTVKHWLWTGKSRIDYYDYPGEAFTAAFGEEENASEEAKKMGNMIKNNIKTAKGIFLILDADKIFNNTDKIEYGKILTHVFRYIQENNKNVKLAIIFSKLELFFGRKPDLLHIISRKYGNAYSCLKTIKYRAFDVYPVGEVKTNDAGEVCPPTTLKPKDILKPVKWMIGF